MVQVQVVSAGFRSTQAFPLQLMKQNIEFRFYVEIDGKQQHPALLSPGYVSTNYPLNTAGLWDIGLLDMNTTFSVMEGIHYLSIQVKSHRHSTQPKPLVTPLSMCPNRDCGVPVLQQQSLSIGSDTVWSVYHCTSNT